MMPNMAPRKSRQRHQNNISQSRPIAVLQAPSDYDSEAYYNAPAQTRTRDDINFSVLRRYVPSLEVILTCAPHAQVYTLLDTETGVSWTRADIEGSMFVCQLSHSPTTGARRYCLVILNRKGMENLIIEFAQIADVEIQQGEEENKILMLAFDNPAREKKEIIGFFFHCDERPSSEEVCQLVKERWEGVRAAVEAGVVENYGEESLSTIEPNGEQTVPMGRRLSLTELFGQH